MTMLRYLAAYLILVVLVALLMPWMHELFSQYFDWVSCQFAANQWRPACGGK